MIDFVVLAQQCAPQVDVNIASAIVKSESSFNPFAIGVNRAAGLKKQPTSYEEAVSVAKRLISRDEILMLVLLKLIVLISKD